MLIWGIMKMTDDILREGEVLRLEGENSAIDNIMNFAGKLVSLNPVFLLARKAANEARLHSPELFQNFFGKDRSRESEETMKLASAAAIAAQQEINLNASEKQSFYNFLQKDYFTKNDFGQLEAFYKNSWDKLSDAGKDEMSNRIWEGVRKGEYSFADLPEDVKKKEQEKLDVQLKAGFYPEIPQKDREDFLQAYKNNDQKAMDEITQRKSFVDNVATEKNVEPQLSKADNDIKIEKDNEGKSAEVTNQVNDDKNMNQALAQIGLEDLDLKIDDAPIATPDIGISGNNSRSI